jgi:hypothetical protein
VAVLDGGGAGRGDALCRALEAAGYTAVTRHPLAITEPARCTLLVLPAHQDAPPDAAQHILSAVASTAAGRTRSSPSRLVMTWHVPQDARAPLAAATGRRNSAVLLLGSSWTRELHRHQDDVTAAVLCRSRQVVRVVSGRVLAGVATRELVRELRVLDPHVVHGLSAQVAEYAGDEVRHHWTATDSIVAAVRVRLAERASSPSGPAAATV